MAEIVNLRRARKNRDRNRKAEEAAQNRLTFGQSHRDKSVQAAKKGKQERFLDGHLLDSSSKPLKGSHEEQSD